MDRAMIMVRLKARQPDGSMVGESRRTCHLVPLPEAGTSPSYLTTYCGLHIAPGAGEVLNAPAGMPCEVCLSRSPVVSFEMLRQVRDRLDGPAER
jgi:hypothetical protein